MNEKIDGLHPTDVYLAQAFRLSNINPNVKLKGYAGDHPAVPSINDDYVFQFEKIREMVAFWTSGLVAMKIQGDPSAGKTSLIEQWHAHMGWPLYKVSCNRNTTAADLIGGLLPTLEGTLKWFDGPVLLAAKLGTSVLLDEFNTLEPDQATGLNMLLESYSVTIPQTGEVITPAKGFRVFATENSVYSKLAVTGRNVQDVANDDRWMVVEADYLPPELETGILVKVLVSEKVDAAAAELMATALVEVANQVRAAFRSDAEQAVTKPMSTRTLIRWAKLIPRFKSVSAEEGGSISYALRRAFGMQPEMATVVTSWAKAKFGT